MSNLLRVLAEQDVADEDLAAAANAAYAVLQERGVDIEGVAPVLNTRVAIETEIVLEPRRGPRRQLHIYPSDEPGVAAALEEAEWTGCKWRPTGRERLDSVEVDGERYAGSGEVVEGP